MRYDGSFHLFDASHLSTYPLRVRSNKVAVGQFQDCAASPPVRDRGRRPA